MLIDGRQIFHGPKKMRDTIPIWGDVYHCQFVPATKVFGVVVERRGRSLFLSCQVGVWIQRHGVVI